MLSCFDPHCSHLLRWFFFLSSPVSHHSEDVDPVDGVYGNLLKAPKPGKAMAFKVNTGDIKPR